MSTSNPGFFRRNWRRFKEWWKSLWPENPRSQSRRSKPSSNQATPNPQQNQNDAEERYEVRQKNGEVTHKTNNLGDALNAWRVLTKQEGTIIDTATGEDLTPDKDENGRYVVFDENGMQIGTFGELSAAERVWAAETFKKGKIIDTVTQKDVTPYKGHLTDEEVQEAVALVKAMGGGYSMFGDGRMEVDPDEVARLIPIINKMKLPIFELANAIGDSHNLPTSTVEVVKREAEITFKDVPYFENVPVGKPPTQFRPTLTPQDRRERRPMRDFSEISRVRPIELAMPGFESRYARMELPVEDNMEEVEGDVPTKRVRKMRKEETITPREWKEKVEVTEDPRVQNLALVVDISGSMDGIRIHIAIALVSVLISKHLDDDSRYSFRWFATAVDQPSTAKSKRGKKKLVKFVLEADPVDVIGGGTNIVDAIAASASDVRSMARGDEIQEVVVITDGHDGYLTSQRIFQAIRTDVVLHSIVIGGDNSALRQHSTTYDTISEWDVGTGRFNRRSSLPRW